MIFRNQIFQAIWEIKVVSFELRLINYKLFCLTKEYDHIYTKNIEHQ